MMTNPRCIILGLILLAQTLHGAPVIEAVSARMKQFVDAKEISGSVTLVADPEKIIHLSADGQADVDTAKPMKEDSVFWIASMTKPVTATAVMMLHEEGLLSVDDPVAKYLPEFRYLKDKEGNDVTITIKQCLLHTTGLEELARADRSKTLAEVTAAVSKLPVKFTPGSKWEYSQSSINTAARVVEVVSATSFPEFLSERLFTPLGMKDTSFYPDAGQIERLASSYKRTPEGGLEKVEFNLFGKLENLSESYPRANGGLFSTAEDYSKFARMILRGGELDGKRYLKEATVKMMTSVQSGDLETGFTPGNAWGLGWCVVKSPQGPSEALSAGSFGHGGMFGTQAWIDPVKKRAYILLVQRADFPNSDASEVRREFQNAAAKNP